MFATGASSAVGSTHNWMKTDFFENTKKGGAYATDGKAVKQWNQPSEHVWGSTSSTNDLSLFVNWNIHDEPILAGWLIYKITTQTLVTWFMPFELSMGR